MKFLKIFEFMKKCNLENTTLIKRELQRIYKYPIYP